MTLIFKMAVCLCLRLLQCGSPPCIVMYMSMSRRCSSWWIRDIHVPAIDLESMQQRSPGLLPLREEAAGARGGRERCWGMVMGPEEARLRLRLLAAAEWTAADWIAADWTGHPVLRKAGAAAAVGA